MNMSKTWIKGYFFIQLFGALLLISIKDISCQTVENDSSEESRPLTISTTNDALAKGLAPFYEMARIFIDVVRPESEDWLLDKIDVDRIIDGTYSQEDWKEIAGLAPEYFVCILAGILFVILIMLGGFFFCCCRLCGKCGGGKVTTREGKSGKTKRLCCGFLLLVFSTLLLAATLLLFMTNEVLYKQTKAENGAVNDLYITMNEIDEFKRTTFDDLRGVSEKAGSGIKNLLDTVRAIPEDALGELDMRLNISKTLKMINELDEVLKTVDNKFNLIKVTYSDLTNQMDELNGVISDAQNKGNEVFDTCSTAACTTYENRLNALASTSDFTQTGINDEISQIDTIRNLDIANSVEEVKLEYNSTISDIHSSVRQNLEDLEREANAVLDQINVEVNDLINKIDSEVNLASAISQVDNSRDEIEQYGSYMHYAGIGIGCLLLMMAVLFFLGLLFGCFGEPVDDYSNCNRSTAASMLFWGMFWSFLFSWILMILLIALFMPGALVYSDGCRYVSNLGVTEESIRAMKIIDEKIVPLLAEENDFNITDTVMSCLQDKGLYEALSLKDFINIEDELNINKFPIDDYTRQLATVNVDVSSLSIFPDTLRNALQTLNDLGSQTINLPFLEEELEKDIINDDLSQMISDLESSNDIPNQTGLNDLIEIIKSVQAMLSTITGQTTQMKQAIQDLKDILDGDMNSDVPRKASALMTNLENIDIQISTNGNDIIRTYLGNKADELYKKVDDFLKSIVLMLSNDVGNCRALYDSINNYITVSFCENLIDTFNAYWFSLGWALAMIIPLLIIGGFLNTEYQKPEGYGATYDKSFDDPKFDEYSGIGASSNIPLENHRRRQRMRELNDNSYNPHKQSGAGYSGYHGAYTNSRTDAVPRNYNRANGYSNNATSAPSQVGSHHSGQSSGWRGNQDSLGAPVGGYNPSQAPPARPPHYYDDRSRAYKY